MKITDVSKEDTIKTPHEVEARKIYDTQDAQVIHLTLKPGEALKKHITPVDVFFYVLEGEGIVEIGSEKQTVAANHLVESPAGILHCWYNEGEEILKILVVKVPRPKEATKLL
ncbi:MAG: cupin domain-containing protein [Candidatus Aadella gelida]|nr:cupin domain-containing protein [Candidatus Aadella gelida]